MFSKLNFQGDPSGSRTVGVAFLASLVLRAKFAAELLRNSECLLASVNVKFERYCDTGIGFAMIKVDMAWGA